MILFTCLGLLVAPAFADYQPKGRRDPFVPLVTPEGQRLHPPGFDEEPLSGPGGLVLQGIVFDPRADSYAIINGRVVRQNDEIAGMRVLKIEAASVTILSEGGPTQLLLQRRREEDS